MPELIVAGALIAFGLIINGLLQARSFNESLSVTHHLDYPTAVKLSRLIDVIEKGNKT